MMSLSLLVGMTINIFTVYIYKHMFESRMSERSTLPESFLNKNIYVRQDPGCQGEYCLRVFMYVCTVCLAGYSFVTDYRK